MIQLFSARIATRTIFPLICLLSGGAALFYEALWTRAFAIILGSTTQAASATFAAFLTGLALGAWILGAYADRIRGLVMAYAALEAAIAVVASGIGLLIHRYSDTLVVALGEVSAYPVFAFPLALALILIPTFLMGGTLPLILALTKRFGGDTGEIGRLYAYNTLGAAVGTLACGFFAIRLFGITNSYFIAAALNLIVATLCIFLPREFRAEPATADAQAGAGIQAVVMEHGNSPEKMKPAPEWLLLMVALSSGLLVLGIEIIWIRMGEFFLGNRVYALTTLLFSVLALLSAGSWLSGHLFKRYARVPLLLLGWILTVAVVSTVLSAVAVGWWIHNQDTFEAYFPLLNTFFIAYRFAETFLLLALVLIPFGTLFPLSLSLSRNIGVRIGGTTGIYYIVNTVGAVIGSLGIGFYAFATVGVFGAVAVIAVLTGILAILMFVLANAKWLSGFSVAAIAFILFLPDGLSLVKPGEIVLMKSEDEYGIFQVIGLPDRTKKVFNNKTELVDHLGNFATSYVQQMQGHLGMFFHPQAHHALVLGSGYGITAGALGIYPSLESVDAVEILPNMVKAADLFQPFNLNYHNNPRVHVFVDDGRHFLALRSNKYDIISINLADPHLPGGSSLFHTEFYDIVKQHLGKGGVVIQHAFGSDVGIILSTLAHSFKYLRLFPSYSNGYNVVASEWPLEFDEDAVKRLTSQPAVHGVLTDLGIHHPERVIQKALRPDDLSTLLRSTDEIATDDRPRIEFSWGRRGTNILFSNE